MQKMIQLEPGKLYHLYTRGNNKKHSSGTTTITTTFCSSIGSM
ncbi:hypothetical protein [Pontibacter kalidii]|nr:hypothetical protein [Pontibacter kalidii]